MTISADIQTGPFTGDGTTTVFAFTFTALSSGEVEVDVNGTAISSSLYTVSIAGGGTGTGTVTFTTAPAAGAIIMLRSNPDYLQESSVVVGGVVDGTTADAVNHRAAVKEVVTRKRLDAASAATPMIVDLYDFTWKGATYSFRNDGVAVDSAAIAALRDLLRTSTASHLELIAPPGVINLGTTVKAPIHIQRSNVTLRGAGKDSTRFLTEGQYHALPGTTESGYDTFQGFSIVIASFHSGLWGDIANVTLRDFEIEDVQTDDLMSPDYVHTNTVSTIFAFNVNDITLDNVRVVNGKGNGSITINGETDSNGPVNYGCACIDVEIESNATRTGVFASGDGYNIGSYRDVRILGGHVKKVKRHALEGGTPGHSMLVDGVLVDQMNQGFSGIAPTGFAEVRIVNCHIRNVASPFYAIDYTSDPGAVGNPSMKNLVIANNIIERGTAGGNSAYPIRMQTIGAPGLIGNVSITGNVFYGAFYYLVLFGANDVPVGIFADNVCRESFTTSSQVLSWVGTVSTGILGAGDTFLVTDNILPSGMKLVDFSSGAAPLKNKQWLRPGNNVVGRSLSDRATGQVGGTAVSNASWISGTVAANSLSASTTVTLLDATPGDRVRVWHGSNWPVGPAAEILANVTANDTITVFVRNSTASTGPALGASTYFHVSVERD